MNKAQVTQIQLHAYPIKGEPTALGQHFNDIALKTLSSSLRSEERYTQNT